MPGWRWRLACGRCGADSTCLFPRVGVGELFPGRSVVQGDESQGCVSPPNRSVRLIRGRAGCLPAGKVGRTSMRSHSPMYLTEGRVTTTDSNEEEKNERRNGGRNSRQREIIKERK